MKHAGREHLISEKPASHIHFVSLCVLLPVCLCACLCVGVRVMPDL